MSIRFSDGSCNSHMWGTQYASTALGEKTRRKIKRKNHWEVEIEKNQLKEEEKSFFKK